jgi:site-specific recombinase XerD
MSETPIPAPVPIFDTLENLLNLSYSYPSHVPSSDFEISKDFLLAYRGSDDTFNAYRKEVDRFLQWLYLILKGDLSLTTQGEIEEFMRFCISPPSDWIATGLYSKFIVDSKGEKVVNPKWRPFVSRISKLERSLGKTPSAATYSLSDSGKKAVLRILSSYFSFLHEQEYCQFNPVKRIRQKSQFVRTKGSVDPVRRLSGLQWETVMTTCKRLADEDPSHERGLFAMTCLYSMYLRVSELAASESHTPSMKDFFKDSDSNWWFKALGKGNKERDISVSDNMLDGLIRYRLSLGLSTLPNPSDNNPLLLRQKGLGAISSTRQIRAIVQYYFNQAIICLNNEHLNLEADELASATAHWLRHTGISDDIVHRPKEHVRDDAGHTSSAITDKYIDVERRERHASAKNKKIIPE